LVAAGASAMAVAKQRASISEMCGLCSAVATACLYDGLRVRLPCRILRLSTDAEMSRCRGASSCIGGDGRGGDARASARACRLSSVLSSIDLSKSKLLPSVSPLNSKPLPILVPELYLQSLPRPTIAGLPHPQILDRLEQSVYMAGSVEVGELAQIAG
jgi:hypothetical protein